MNKNPIINQLIDLAKDNGNKISSSTLTDLLETIDLDSGVANDIYETLNENNIIVIDDNICVEPVYETRDDAEESEITSNSFKDYLKDIGKYAVLSPEEELLYCKKAYNGDTNARNKLVVHNLRLVVFVAKRYFEYLNNMDMLDIIQEGNLGLMHAIDNFNPDNGVRLSTYAVWWIRQHIYRSMIRQNKMIKSPEYLMKSNGMLMKATDEFMMEHERQPTKQELSDITGISIKRIEYIQMSVYDTISLDEPIENTDNVNREDCIKDDDPTPDELMSNVICNSNASELVDELLSLLNERDSEIIKLRFGLTDERRPYTLRDVARKYGLTKERIRQIEQKSLRFLHIYAIGHGINLYEYVN